ncbi:menaquinone biosynthetic enzyme MqnA/MqnD family protein [Taibaiella chishuiensis]|uniref:Chorismate dehydratase n=1 Tax=Taibaiella chishuiensis TaxID=1434707 RepID=A0A2P8CVM9_9BACT|nr:menaquinone biosynthesis protein [Taibaiella chishuiensis]PSK89028.1 chorismate dehydratase [Taibaiella chishuiensis]
MNRKIKVSAVSYLNTKPLLYGIERHAVMQDMDLVLEYPSLIARHLQEDTTDIGLVPVAAIPSIPNARIISDYGIGADGKVASVCIFSKVPMEQIRQVYLDYQSRTSVRLAQVLLRHYWKQDVEFLQAPENYIDLVSGTTAAVIIGDRALEQLGNFAYIYDLAENWKAFTGLPFIFAAWVANKELPESFIRQFNEANAAGLEHLDEVIAENPYPAYDLNVYYRENILYYLDETKKQGLARFLEYLKEPAII